MRVSVVIPVYNAAYIEQAVASALQQAETGEVLLVDDGSQDDSLARCQALSREHPVVQVLQHRGGANRGAGLTRNLGIENASEAFIAFLDADDYYLPKRFAVAKEILVAQPDVDGVYETVENFYEDAAAQQLTHELDIPRYNTIAKMVAPGDLFDVILAGEHGQFLPSGLVVRKTLFEKTGYFDAMLHEDYAMAVKMAALGKLVPGHIAAPVTMRRIHDTNSIATPRPEAEQMQALQRMWQALWLWSREQLDAQREAVLFDKFLKSTRQRYQGHEAISKQLAIAALFTRLLLRDPDLLARAYFREHYLEQFRIRRLIVERVHHMLGR